MRTWKYDLQKAVSHNGIKFPPPLSNWKIHWISGANKVTHMGNKLFDFFFHLPESWRKFSGIFQFLLLKIIKENFTNFFCLILKIFIFFGWCEKNAHTWIFGVFRKKYEVPVWVFKKKLWDAYVIQILQTIPLKATPHWLHYIRCTKMVASKKFLFSKLFQQRQPNMFLVS